MGTGRWTVQFQQGRDPGALPVKVKDKQAREVQCKAGPGASSMWSRCMNHERTSTLGQTDRQTDSMIIAGSIMHSCCEMPVALLKLVFLLINGQRQGKVRYGTVM